jgi:transposase
MLRCTLCGFTVDRDVNAARNILARGLRFKPDALPSEAMVKERVALTPILKVDGSEVS